MPSLFPAGAIPRLASYGSPIRSTACHPSSFYLVAFARRPFFHFLCCRSFMARALGLAPGCPPAWSRLGASLPPYPGCALL
eukprot:4005325-Alexandrium_andersonii.AAC.1